MIKYAFLSLSSFLLFSIITFSKTFVYCSEGSPSSFNPQISTDGPSNNASTHTLYNRLVEFKYGTTKIIPSLASSYHISKDKLVYIFFLRKDVHFHSRSYFKPSRNFNADDVLFSFNRQFQKNHPFHQVGGGHYEYFYAMNMHKLIKSIEKINDYQVKITLNTKDSTFLADIAMSFMSILSKEYGNYLLKIHKPEQIDYKPIGTGPFLFKSYQKDTIIRFEKNNNYFRKKALIDKLIISITPEPNVRFLKLIVGECNLIIDPSPNDLSVMSKYKNIKVISSAGMNISYLAINTIKPPFDKLEVRRAINMAINKTQIIKKIYKNTAILASYPLPETVLKTPRITHLDYNPIKAKEIIAKLHLTKQEKNITLWTLPISRPYNPNGKKMGEIMQSDLKKIGFNVKLISYDWPTYLKKGKNGDHDLLQLGWSGDNGAPDNFLGVLLSCASVLAQSNYAKWCNKQFDKLINDAKQNTSKKARTLLYLKAVDIFRHQLPWVPIAHTKVFRAMSKNVIGYKIDPLGADIFSFVDLAPKSLK